MNLPLTDFLIVNVTTAGQFNISLHFNYVRPEHTYQYSNAQTWLHGAVAP